MTSNGTAWTELLAGEIDPDEDRVDRDDDGTEFGVAMGIRLAQVLHHGTDHRSQIGTALTSLDLAPPENDSGASLEQPVASGWCPRRPSRCRSPTRGRPGARIGPEQAVGLTERRARQTARPRRALRR
jgi:hypothetical protein